MQQFRHRTTVLNSPEKRRRQPHFLGFFSLRRTPLISQQKGFALIVTLSLMILLTVIAVGLLTLSSISLRSSGAQAAQATANANARMAMMIALGELQRGTGIDQSVTMNSDVMSSGQSQNPHWIGSTPTLPTNRPQDAKQSQVRWLVSGNNPTPNTTLTASSRLNQGNGLRLATFTEAAQQREILAPVVNINPNAPTGRYAYHISDEGAKARVNLERPVTAPGNIQEQIARANSPMESGLVNINSQDWQNFAPLPEGKIRKNNLISIPTAAIAANNIALPRQYYNDVTTGGFGLPVNVDAGGMKADLSLIFDRSQASKNYGTTYFGATGAVASTNGVARASFMVDKPELFFLSENIRQGRAGAVGPNWGNLWNYAILWQSVNNQQIPIVQADPQGGADMRYKNWPPYTGHDAGNFFAMDVQHTNSPVSPIISHFQMGFRFNATAMPPATPGGTARYQPQIVIQPVIGLWNPYNVRIAAASFLFEWALYPYFEFSVTTPGGAPQRNQLWMREVWNSGNGLIASDAARTGGTFIALRTPSVDLQPGEFRFFSVDTETEMGNFSTLRALVAGWSEGGGYRVNMRAADGKNLILPAGTSLKFERIFLQDTQFPETLARTNFQTLDINKASSVWFGLKFNYNPRDILSRSTEIWNGGNDPSTTGRVTVPEPIIPRTSRTTYVLGPGVSGSNIAAWAFHLRTTNQIEQPDQAQTLRGWIDSNPRALVSNSRWDGSNVDSSGNRSGWHTSSQYIGAYNFPNTTIGDGNGGNRGLLSEEDSNTNEPNVSRAGGRYQGFGGAANTQAGGRNHVIIYDVPQAPLTSIGQFQHAHLGRYNFEPGFVLGNSYANPRVPLNATINPNFNGFSDLTMTDVSYDVNRRIWDSFFFSTLGADYINASGNSLDSSFDFNRLKSGQQILSNPRMLFSPLPGDTGVDQIINAAADRAPEAIAARIRIAGAFNVNSTSKNAWKAVLSSMVSSELPSLNPQNLNVSWVNNGGIRFNRFGRVLTQVPYTSNTPGNGDSFWQGWRSLNDQELDQLATEIVNEVRNRGPFRTMAEFVNRNPFSARPADQLKGPLQAALDRTVNAGLPSSVGEPSVQPAGAHFSRAINGESSAAGNASYLQQGDLLQSLAPILQVRSDYFRIRACGEALDATGKVTARAWCEAFVQRSASFVDPQDAVFINPANLTAAPNRVFGRKYDIVSFRWLNSNEV